MKKCSECFAGENDVEATTLVEHPNPDRPNLKIRKWVCDEHYAMLADDYPELRVIR